MDKKLTHATTMEWYASLFGACFVAFGLGLILASSLEAYTGWIILFGIGLHGWGMFKIHQRNR